MTMDVTQQHLSKYTCIDVYSLELVIDIAI